jgi:Methylase of chemotaxis methyl-accepting proteins
LRHTGIDNFKDYYDYLIKDDSGEELVVMLDAISTNNFLQKVTHSFM